MSEKWSYRLSDYTMKKIKLLLLAVLATVLASCGSTSTVPITGRKQHLLVSDQQVLSLSNEQYTEYMKSAKLSANSSNTAMVRRVGQRLATAVEAYLRQNGMADQVSEYQWSFSLVQDNNVNAFCMPGGKIVVYEGLLPVTQNEASLAVVLGHEIAHAVARHSAERLSNEYKQQYGLQAISAVAAGAGVSAGAQQLGALVAGVGTKLFTAGFSRKQESEADHMGLVFAAMAGYDPTVATAFWQRMAAQGSGSASILSDHPSDEKRIADIAKWMPEAQKYYKPQTSAVKTQAKASSAKKSAKGQSQQAKTGKSYHFSTK